VFTFYTHARLRYHTLPTPDFARLPVLVFVVVRSTCDFKITGLHWPVYRYLVILPLDLPLRALDGYTAVGRTLSLPLPVVRLLPTRSATEPSRITLWWLPCYTPATACLDADTVTTLAFRTSPCLDVCRCHFLPLLFNIAYRRHLPCRDAAPYPAGQLCAMEPAVQLQVHTLLFTLRLPDAAFIRYHLDTFTAIYTRFDSHHTATLPRVPAATLVALISLPADSAAGTIPSACVGFMQVTRFPCPLPLQRYTTTD